MRRCTLEWHHWMLKHVSSQIKEALTNDPPRSVHDSSQPLPPLARDRRCIQIWHAWSTRNLGWLCASTSGIQILSLLVKKGNVLCWAIWRKINPTWGVLVGLWSKSCGTKLQNYLVHDERSSRKIKRVHDNSMTIQKGLTLFKKVQSPKYQKISFSLSLLWVQT